MLPASWPQNGLPTELYGAISSPYATPSAMPSFVPNISPLAYAQLGPAPPPPAHVFIAPQPWHVAPAHLASLQAALSQQAFQLASRPDSPQAVQPKQWQLSKPAQPAPSNKKGMEERAYTETQFRAMLTRVVNGHASSAVAARDAGFPSAERSLRRYAREIKESRELQRNSPAATLEAQLAYVSSMELKHKGNVDLTSRRIFSDDDLDYFARALKVYAELGWPMDYQAIQLMFSQAAREMELVDWKTGDPYVCSRKYVADFVNDHPELTAYKAAHIDPLRSKKATATVRAVGCGDLMMMPCGCACGVVCHADLMRTLSDASLRFSNKNEWSRSHIISLLLAHRHPARHSHPPHRFATSSSISLMA